MSDPPQDPKFAGFEAIAAFNWGVGRLAADAITLNLSHPRHGGLTYAISHDMARAIIKRMEEALSTPPSIAPPVPPPTLQ